MQNRKETRASQAVEWTERMQKNDSDEIQSCIRNTKIYTDEIHLEYDSVPHTHREVVIKPADTVSALFEESDENIAVLNFASYRYPGGGFIRGSMAQEEALCHESFLYNVLSAFDDTYYEYNRTHTQNRGLYTNRMLYTPDVRFFHNGKTKTSDVITCAAPNHSVGLKYGNVTEQENLDALTERIRFIYDAAEINHISTLILGAYGCGVFRQNPKDTACAFRIMSRDRYHFRKLVFAVPDENSDNYIQMKKWL